MNIVLMNRRVLDEEQHVMWMIGVKKDLQAVRESEEKKVVR